MTDDERDDEGRPDSLGPLLQAWKVEPPGHDLEVRLREGFARRQRGARSWPLLLRTSVRVPLPLLAALVILCVVSSVAAMRAGSSSPMELPAVGAPGASAIAPRTASALGGFEPILQPRLTVVAEEVK